MVSQRLLSLAAVAAALPSGLAFSGALPSGLARARSGAPARRVAPSAMLPDAHAFAATLPPAASAALGDALGGSTLALAKTPYGPTCMDEGGPWCGWQNFVQGTIVNLHGVIDGSLGIHVADWGFTIIAFTFCCRLITFPLIFIQYSSSERIKLLGPYTEKIKEKYPDNKELQQQLIGRLYQDTDTNPLAGCLPSLAQIPLFIALYRSVLNLALNNKIDQSFFWIPSLEGPTFAEGRGLGWLLGNEEFGLSWVDGVPPLGWETTALYCVVPIALVFTQALSLSLTTPKPTGEEDASAKRLMLTLKFLPLLIGFFAAQVPAGLGLYWMTSNVFSTSANLGVKAYIKANPPDIEWDYFDTNEARVQRDRLPENIEDAIFEARNNLRPSQTARWTPPPL